MANGIFTHTPRQASHIEMLVYKLIAALGGLSLKVCTQEVYDAMETHDANTLYIIVEAQE